MADVASKQPTTALFLSTIVTRTRRHTELTKKLTDMMGNLCCAGEQAVRFFVQFYYTVKMRSLTLRLLMSYIYGAPSKARNANVVYIWTYVWQR